MSTSEWNSLVVSKGNSFWGCSRFLKYRSEQVQIHTEEAFWRWITTYMKEVEKRPVICQGDYGSNEWMGTFSRAKIHIISQTYWIEYRTSLNSLRSCTPEHSANQLFLYLHMWPSLAPNFLSLNNLTVQNFNNSHTLSVNFCSSYMLLLFLCPGIFFPPSLPFQILPNLQASASLWQSQGGCLKPFRQGGSSVFYSQSILKFLFGCTVTLSRLSRKLF